MAKRIRNLGIIMLAVITLGNQQFRVSQDQVFLAQKTPHEVGSEFETPIHLLAQENKINVGSPTLGNASVKIKVLEEVRGKKIHGFKYKKRKNYMRSWGHRQDLQKLQVVSISA